jgi:hypothetical protein
VIAGVAFLGILAVIGLGLRKNRPADDPAPSAGPAAVAAPGAIEDPKVVTASDGQSRMTVPGNWREMPDLNDEAEIELGNLLNEQYAIVLTENRADFTDDVDLARFTEVVTQNLRNSLLGATVSEPRPLTIQGRPALQRTLQGSTNGLRIAYWLTTIEGQRSYFQVVMWTLASRADENEPVYQAVVSGFQEVVR